MAVSATEGNACTPEAYRGPVLGVHVLTEFVYCPRAGLVALGEETEDVGEDEKPGRLDYLPRYDLRNIENALQRTLQRLGALCIGLLVTSVVTLLVMTMIDSRGLWLGALLGAVLVVLIGQTFADFVRLTARRATALAAVAREPSFGADNKPVRVDWWQLRRAGFTAARYEVALKDEKLRTAGRPYLVLHRGDVCIPVFRQHRPTSRLYRQHFVRMAAYCHLIERCTGYRAPYGVILLGTSYEGVAVPSSAAAQQAFRESLLEARRVIRNSRIGDDPPPAPVERCRDCPIGHPREYEAGKTETRSHGGWLPADCSKDRRDRLYHSRCGDRFHWLPPHSVAAEKGLWRQAR